VNAAYGTVDVTDDRQVGDYARHFYRGFEVAYSTCTRRRLRPYARLGAHVLAETSIAGEDRFFLRWLLRD
jgi:hypothetical protein